MVLPNRVLGAIALAVLASALAASAAAERGLAPRPEDRAVEWVAEPGAPAAPLSQQQLAKLQKFIDAKHRKAVIDPEMARLLGLGKDGKPVVALQVSLVEKDQKTRHLFDRLEDGSGFLVGKRTGDGLAVYYLKSDLTSFSSVMWRADGNKVALATTDTAAALRGELALWARFADQLK